MKNENNTDKLKEEEKIKPNEWTQKLANLAKNSTNGIPHKFMTKQNSVNSITGNMGITNSTLPQNHLIEAHEKKIFSRGERLRELNRFKNAKKLIPNRESTLQCLKELVPILVTHTICV